MENNKIVLIFLLTSTAINVGLVITRLTLAIIHDSMLVLADAIHTSIDLALSLMLVFAFCFSSRGKEKVIPIVLFVFGFIIVGIGIYFGYVGVTRTIDFWSTEPQQAAANTIERTCIPIVGREIIFARNWWLIGSVAVSVFVKVALAITGTHINKKAKSELIKADVIHSYADAGSSFVVLFGLLIGMFTTIAMLILAGAVIVAGIMVIRNNNGGTGRI